MAFGFYFYSTKRSTKRSEERKRIFLHYEDEALTLGECFGFFLFNEITKFLLRGSERCFYF